MTYAIDVPPCPRPRETRRDVWNPRPSVVRYRAWKDKIKRWARQNDFALADEYTIVFEVQMPKSWSRKKREAMDGTAHRQRPDLDNYLKAVNDTLLPDDDSTVWNVSARKVWASEGRIIIMQDIQ